MSDGAQWQDYTPPKKPAVSPGQTADLSGWSDYKPSSSTGTPIKDNSTIGPPPATYGAEQMENPTNLPQTFIRKIENYTPQGRQEHPVLSRIGDVARGATELISGGQSAGEPLGTEQGLMNSPVVNAISMAPAAAEGAESLTEGIGGAIRKMAPSVDKAESLSNRALFPREMPVGDQPVVHEEFRRVAKGVAPYTKATPLEGGEGGALRGAHVARQAAQNIWNDRVEPVIDSFGPIRRPTSDIASSIRGTVSDTDRQMGSPRARATDKLANLYQGQSKTVQEMSNRVRELNNDKAVARFQDMNANEQSQALLGDPSLRGKVAELNALRTKMFDTIAEEGGEALGNQFQEARKDWGALRSYDERVMNAKVPTPQPLHVRVANTVRTFVSPRGVDFYARPTDTLGRLNNPNRLIPKALNMAGRTAEAEEPMLMGDFRTVTPTARMLPPAGGTSEGAAPLGGIRIGGRGLREEIDVPAGHRTELNPVQVGESITEGGKLARIPGRDYREPYPTIAGPRQPVPPRQTVGVHEPASSISGADIRAPLRARYQRVLDDPTATQAEKVQARERLRLIQ